jgi:branched-chain amino acid aminotransferase
VRFLSLPLGMTKLGEHAPQAKDQRRVGCEDEVWGDLTRGLFDAYDRGGETVVLVDSQGNIAEGPGFNVFAVIQGVVRSPGGTVLEGITKMTVNELCEELGTSIKAGPVTPKELRSADEVFLSSTAGGIMPVTRVDDETIGNGRPGSVTTSLKDLYWAKHQQGWHATAVRYDDE